MRDLSFGQFLDGLSSRAPTPAGGALAFATLAGCAALAAKLARLAHADAEVFIRWSELFSDHAGADADFYAPGDPNAFAGELHRAENARDFVKFIDAAPFSLPDRAKPDFEAARALAGAALGVIAGNLKANLGLLKGGSEDFTARVAVILRRES